MLLNLLSRQRLKNKTDLELVELLRSGDMRAHGELFRRYEFKIYGVCLKYFKDVEMAKDSLMNLFEVLPQKLIKAQVENFGGWIYQVAKNECLMVLRKKKTHKLPTSEIQLEDTSEESLKMAELNEKQLSILEESIEELKPDQKKCISLFYLEQKSYKEIENLGIYTLKEIKSHIQNGKRKLKLIIEQKPKFFEI